MEKVFKLVLWVGGTIFVLGALGRLFLFDTWTIPNDPWLGASIAPTLAPGDTVLLLTRGEPGFGDLVRCDDPERDGYVVGRIAGLAGDQVSVEGKTLRVNDKRYQATEACKEPTLTVAHPDSGDPMELQCARIEMGGGWHFRATRPNYDATHDHDKLVGPGKLYLLSDNRDYHDDSRDFGTIPASSCHGRIVFRLWGSEGWTDSSRRLDVIR